MNHLRRILLASVLAIGCITTGTAGCNLDIGARWDPAKKECVDFGVRCGRWGNQTDNWSFSPADR